MPVVTRVTVIVWQLMVRLYVALVALQPAVSLALTTMGNVPLTLGVPESTPFVASVKPAGSVLEVVKVVVPAPPVFVNVSLKAASTVPVLLGGVVTITVPQLMTSE